MNKRHCALQGESSISLKSCQCYRFSSWKVFQMILGRKKKFFSRLLYPGIAGSIPGPNESITGARTKMPVLFIEQNELKPYIPSPSLSWLHLMCGTCCLDHFLSPAQELQNPCKISNVKLLGIHVSKDFKRCMSLIQQCCF